MPRSVNSVASRARRKNTMKLAKGYFGRRKNVWTVSKNAVEKGLTYAYRDRKNKKRNFRSLWIQRINAGARQHGLSYSEFMGKVNAKGIELNRKVLADLAMNNPEAFKAVVDAVK
ncbi:MAG: 50S ribosomal protein L20 [Flavobacteriales bacterium]|nr:50S ribosomal protein L20 [Flavobacteriales bacterium]|tara:strand:+ start:11844 stop:12188 length:345 start_codon:yes stop_codon:yes gene_type:complete